jgi:hypothetical protein
MRKTITLKPIFCLCLVVCSCLSFASVPQKSPNNEQASSMFQVYIDGYGEVECHGDTAEYLEAITIGGTPSYTYLWSNGATEQIIFNIPAGPYSVTVTDATGATAVANKTIVEPDSIIVYEDFVIPVTCTDPAKVTLAVINEWKPFNYVWSNGGTGPTNTVSPGELPVTVTVSLNHYCPPATYVIYTIPYDTAAPMIMATGGVLTCKNPVINLSAEGSDIGPCITYFWEGPGNYQAYESNPPVSKQGLYTLTLVNVCTGCMSSASAEVTEDMAIPFIDIDIPVDTFSCDVPVIEIDACLSEGSGFSWSTANGMISYGADSCVLGVALPGVYTLNFTNPEDGCTATVDVTIGGIGAPLPRIDSIQHVSCYGATDGYVGLSVVGGKAPYEFLWPDSSTLMVRSDLGAGSYVITITDSTGCQSLDTLTILQPDPILLNLGVNHESAPGANDGSATIDPLQGVPPYVILWSSGDTTLTLTGLAPGAYGVTVTDSIGCSIQDTFQIMPFACPLALEAVTTSLACHGDQTGRIELIINNPIGSYTILWGNGANGEILDSLGAAIYTVEIVDSVGCVAMGNYEITAPPPLEITLDSLMGETTSGSSDGAIFISVTGGEGGYTYEWKNENGEVVGTTKDLEDVEKGIYELCITDTNGCVLCQTFTILTNAISPSWRDGVLVYPNPVSDMLYISLPESHHYDVAVYTALGVLYAQQNITGTHWQIPVATWPSGVYWIRVRDEKGQTGTYKVIR